MTSWLSRPSLLRTLITRARLTVRLLREPRVPLVLKAVPVLAVCYIVFPLDVVPDVLPVLGELDDLGVLVIAVEAFLLLCPAAATEFHRAALAQGSRYCPMPLSGEVIDAEFRHADDDPPPS